MNDWKGDLSIISFIFMSILVIMATVVILLRHFEYLNYIAGCLVIGLILFTLSNIDREDLFLVVSFGPIIICPIILVGYLWGTILT